MSQSIAARLASFQSEGAVVPRNPKLAVVLSACPGLGQHYAGHIVRGIVMYVLLIVASWLAAVAFMFVESRLSVVFLAVPFVGVAAIALDAWNCARRQDPEYHLKWFNRMWIYVGVTLFLMVTVNPLMDSVVGRHIVRAFFVTSSTMAPTLLNHDLVLVDKLTAPSRGDVLLLDFSDGTPVRLSQVIVDDQLVRRVVALPGDTVEMRGHDVWVNSEKLEEGYATYASDSPVADDGSGFRFGPAQVPADHYFVLADQRARGFDSRLLGFIPRKRVAGTVTKIFWSWNFERGSIKWSRTAMSL